jgi:hypothetical protein
MLSSFKIEKCSTLADFRPLGRLSTVDILNLNFLPLLQDVDVLSNLTQLMGLCVSGNASLSNLLGLSGVTNVAYLQIDSNPMLTTLQGIGNL